MDPSDVTISSLTSEPEDLTVMHTQSGLPTEHTTRRTTDGFLIEANRLPHCVLLPASIKPSRSWVWDHGIALGRAHSGEIIRHWLCKTCYNGTIRHPLTHYLLPAAENTIKAINHLQQRHGFDRQGNTVVKKRKRHDLSDAWSQQQHAHNSTFDDEG
jgi:hypothetical protein